MLSTLWSYLFLIFIIVQKQFIVEFGSLYREFPTDSDVSSASGLLLSYLSIICSILITTMMMTLFRIGIEMSMILHQYIEYYSLHCLFTTLWMVLEIVWRCPPVRFRNRKHQHWNTVMYQVTFLKITFRSPSQKTFLSYSIFIIFSKTQDEKSRKPFQNCCQQERKHYTPSTLTVLSSILRQHASTFFEINVLVGLMLRKQKKEYRYCTCENIM